MATTAFYPNSFDVFFANPLLLGQPQIWEHPVSLFDEGMADDTLITQNHGLEMDFTQVQLAQSHLPLPQINWGSKQELQLLYGDQATMPVSMIVYP